ncbi:MAG: PEP-CTERM sorting domain-containing protein [Proteobacteria bacterium]|nr:PEP-CTERM sorting domain-containing protein [Pseudomonadota bacterium]
MIGDGSGPTQTGVGSMQVDRVHIDTAPQISTLTSVPVPGALPLLGSALAAAAFMRRRRRDACGAMT